MDPADSSLLHARRKSGSPSLSSTSRPVAAAQPHPASSSSTSLPSVDSQPCPALSSQRPTIYPPILPPSNFFDLELEAEKLKDMFKVSNSLKNPLYDETGLVNLPTDAKGNLILDPESRTRMVDVEVEFGVLYEYMLWMKEVKEAGLLGEDGNGEEWLEGLSEAVNEDFGEVFDEWLEVVDEERGKRGLSDRYAHWGAYKGQTYDAKKKEWKRIEQQKDDRSSLKEKETSSRSPTLIEYDDDNLISSEEPKVDDDASQTEIETTSTVLSPRDIAGDKGPSSETPKTIVKEAEESTLSQRALLSTEDVVYNDPLPIAPPIDLVTLWW